MVNMLIIDNYAPNCKLCDSDMCIVNRNYHVEIFWFEPDNWAYCFWCINPNCSGSNETTYMDNDGNELKRKPF